VAEFGLAVNREWSSQGGEKKESTCFLDIVVYGKGAEVVHQYMKKGRQIFIEGRLDYSEWQDKTDGKKRSRIRIVSENFQFLDGGKPRDTMPGEEAIPAGDSSSSAVREPFPSGRGGGGRGETYRPSHDTPPLDDLDPTPPGGNDLPF
jgi:single-strand DNA-binding protein